MKLTLDYRTCFIAMWLWLSKHPGNKKEQRLNEKEDWPGHKTIMNFRASEKLKIFGYFHYLSYHCFACLSLGKDAFCLSHLPCCKCPVDWGTKQNCLEDNTLFSKWEKAKNVRERSKYALAISKAWKE